LGYSCRCLAFSYSYVNEKVIAATEAAVITYRCITEMKEEKEGKRKRARTKTIRHGKQPS